jgi:hypothetical protein
LGGEEWQGWDGFMWEQLRECLIETPAFLAAIDKTQIPCGNDKRTQISCGNDKQKKDSSQKKAVFALERLSEVS